MEETTVSVQQAAKDTVLMTFETDSKILILNKDTNLVEYKLYGENHGNSGALFVFFFGMLVGGIVFHFLFRY